MSAARIPLSPRPLLDFILGGTQKGGTTALASYLAEHPALALPAVKELHFFDDPDFDENWDSEAIDRRLREIFPDTGEGRCHGDATPVSMFLPTTVARIHRYRPDMKWVILLRHPAERAISHYFMERERGRERLPLWLALLAESWRLRNSDERFDAPRRLFSYRSRGRYVEQIARLEQYFGRERILLLRSQDLDANPEAVLKTIEGFLGLPTFFDSVEKRRIFAGRYTAPSRRGWLFRCLAWSYRAELRELRRRYGIVLD